MIDINLGDFDIDDDFISEEKYLINISVNSRNKEVHIKLKNSVKPIEWLLRKGWLWKKRLKLLKTTKRKIK